MTSAFSPTSLAEAHEALGRGAVKVAGTTDLLVIDHATGRQHDAVLNVLGIAELRGIRIDAVGLSIGAATTFTQIRQSADVVKHAPMLVEAAATIGAAQIQNRATLGGNIANASPAGDSLPALLALNAQLILSGPRGRRTLAYDTFHTDYRKTALAADELIERIVLPLPAPTVQIFRKVGTRAAQAISKVVIGFSASRDAISSHRLMNVRLAMGSVAATPLRLTAVEALIGSGLVSAALADDAAQLVERTIHPIDDVRSTADYRRHVAGQSVRRLLLDLSLELTEPSRT
ncbi:MAG: FAD binding domain-containing protein [Vicinamibacteria bacterium]